MERDSRAPTKWEGGTFHLSPGGGGAKFIGGGMGEWWGGWRPGGGGGPLKEVLGLGETYREDIELGTDAGGGETPLLPPYPHH